MKSSRTNRVDLAALLALFPEESLLDDYQWLPPEEVPEPYHSLLVHPKHMTVTMERFHGDRVALRVMDRVHEGDHYARMILLTLEKTGEIVQFGIMRFDFRYCDAATQEAIIRGQTPLGRILIERNILRRIHPKAYLKISPGKSMMKCLELEKSQTLYGRLATIFCNGEPAVELLEVSAPLGPLAPS